jgi:hypothetical protein
MTFRLFDLIDAALVGQESKSPKAALIPSVWPSEASAERIDKTESDIVGKCGRAVHLRMIGYNITNQVDPVGAWRWVTGRMIEQHLSDLAELTTPNIFVASGVRHFVPDLFLPFELDLVVIDPVTKRGWITECKTFYGYQATKSIVKESTPKLDNLMQASLYLSEIKTGKRLKEIIKQGVEDRKNSTGLSRNRIEADLAQLELMDDGPLGAKLAYISRDECLRKEFTIELKEDFDGSIYPAVDGQMWKIFTMESVYARYRLSQDYWFRARREALGRLAQKGIHKPDTLHLVLSKEDVKKAEEPIQKTEEQKQAENEFLMAMEREVKLLPNSFWPPADYQWSYSPEKIEKLFIAGKIGKLRYNDWKKKKEGKDRIGDWQCLYCPFKKACVPLQNPNWSYQLYHISDLVTEEGTET